MGKKPELKCSFTIRLCVYVVQGTHVWKNKGWEYSTYMALIGAPLILYLGLTNVPETDSEVFARCATTPSAYLLHGQCANIVVCTVNCYYRNEAYALRKGSEQFEIVKRVSGPISSRYTYEKVRCVAVHCLCLMVVSSAILMVLSFFVCSLSRRSANDHRSRRAIETERRRAEGLRCYMASDRTKRKREESVW